MTVGNCWTALWWLLTIAKLCHRGELRVIIQSTECTPKDIERKTQCFKEIPKEIYEAVVNQTVVMRCIVENQHGRVQWRAQKTTMGFDRAIPAMPRFRITGDATKSEYFLTIYSIQLSDNGDYECQVEPIKHHPLLRRRTHLFVYRRPSPPYISYKSWNVSNSNILIDPNEECFLLKCTSLNGVPTPTFLWKSKDKYLNSSRCANIHETRLAKLDESILVIRLSEIRDQQWVECIISSRALVYDSEQMTLSTKVQIKFQKLPGYPKTDVEKLAVTDQESLKTRCSLSPIGVPKAQLFWKWSNDTVKRIPANFSDLRPYSKLIVESNQMQSILTLPSVTTEMHATTLLCQSVYFNQSVESAAVLLLVNFLPKKLEIYLGEGPLMASSDQKDFSIYPIKEREIYLFKCKTSKYYGDYDLSWGFQQNYQQTALHTNILVHEKLAKENEFFYNQVSSIEFVANRTMHSAILVCSIGKKMKISVYIHLEVLYLPKEVIISSSHSKKDSYLTVGDIVEINCTIENGNPIPDLSMYLDGTIIEKTQFSKKEISVKIIIERKHDQSKIYCQANSQHFPHVYVQSKFVKLVLALLPRQILMTFLSPNSGVVETGQRQSLSCTVIGSNPEPSISWRLKLCQILTKQLTEIKENCQMQDIKTVYSNFSFVNSKESQLTSIMTWQPTWLYHKSTIICKVYNYHFPRKIFQKTLEIKVIFKPKIFIYPREKKFEIFEGENKTFIIDIASNPVLEYLLCLNCTESTVFVKSMQPFYTKWSLSIKSATMRHRGYYYFVASNKIGTSNYTIYIDIKTAYNQARLDTVHVFLSALSNTLSYTPPRDVIQGNLTFSWSLRRDDQFNETILECNQGLYDTNDTIRYLKLFVKCKGGESTTLVFYYIHNKDKGKYICNLTANGRVIISTVYISTVLMRPTIVKRASVKKFGCDLYGNCLLSCFFTTAGQTSIEWYRNVNDSSILNSTNFISSSSEIVETRLLLLNISHEQYGNYSCKISNDAGSDIWSLRVVEPTLPEKPGECSVNTNERSFANVTWFPGFSGGRPQIFKIQWTTDSKNEASWITEFIKPKSDIKELSYIIKDLASNISCAVKISASNVFGESEYCTNLFHTPSFSATTLPSFMLVKDQQYLKVLAYTLAICSVSIVLIVIITGLQKVNNIIRDRRSVQHKSMSRFISLNNRLYSSMIENDKDISMIFTNKTPASPDQPRRNYSGNTSLMNISDHS